MAKQKKKQKNKKNKTKQNKTKKKTEISNEFLVWYFKSKY